MKIVKRMGYPLSVVCLIYVTTIAAEADAAHPLAAARGTSLTDSSVEYRTAKEHHVVLTRGDVTAIIVDNAAIHPQIGRAPCRDRV